MRKTAKITLKKLAAAKDAAVPPADPATYQDGALNNFLSLPIDYELKGELLSDVVIGQPLQLFRSHRNGVAALGLTTTSFITSIETQPNCTVLTTENSVYLLSEEA